MEEDNSKQIKKIQIRGISNKSQRKRRGFKVEEGDLMEKMKMQRGGRRLKQRKKIQFRGR